MKTRLVALAVFGLLMVTITTTARSDEQNRRDKEGLTELHRAAGRGDTPRVVTLIDHGADPLALDSQMGISVLHKAVYSGNPETVVALLDRGALVDLQSPSNGDTPLHDALYFKNGKDLRIVRALVEHGASLSIRNRAGLVPIESARLLKDTDSVRLLEEAWAKRFPPEFVKLMSAVKSNDVAKAKMIIKKQPEWISFRDEQGFSPLIWAAREGMVELVDVLLRSGADPNQNDVWMRANAGHKAAFWGRTSVMEHLIAAKFALNARGGYNGYTALHDAISRDHIDVVKVLVNAGARVDIAGHDGKTPLDIALSRNNKEILQILEKAKSRQ